MADSGRRKKTSSFRDNQGFRRMWCCSSAIPPKSPENLSSPLPKKTQKSEILSKSGNSLPNSPQSYRTGLGLVGRIDPRRILSPGRVSPIDSDISVDHVQEIVGVPSPVGDVCAQLGSETFQATPENFPTPERSSPSNSALNTAMRDEGCSGVFDARLSLKAKNGDCLVLQLDSKVLSANSSIFADLISDFRKGSGGNHCRIEVPDVENFAVFRETIELMFEEDITRRLMKMGVSRSIDILEVSAGLMFTRGVLSCLKYLEAVPWDEDEEEKLKSLFTRFTFDDATTRDILARLYPLDQENCQQNLAIQLVWSIINGADLSARRELKCLLNGLLSRSSVYEKNSTDLKKEDLYLVCQSCLASLLRFFEEASDSIPEEKFCKPLIERIATQVDNINWLLDILVDRQMAEEFVDMWMDQGELIGMHKRASPMVRYELSRISAWVFIALGTGKLHCRSETRLGVLQAWFGPMLADFGWLQRCRKGLDVKALEEAMGHTLLTLPLKQQYLLFMEWFECYTKHGTECPNLSKAFEIWWRRCFLRGFETHSVESGVHESLKELALALNDIIFLCECSSYGVADEKERGLDAG
ncbi:hypothetical protein HHK36_030481 [Tetracentron sinense]|uniref:At3g05675-like ankyrin-like domain-containing protein n=1 Tax=Tetracentron sinense TaxID=13715 RepID=A0A834Y7J5_TETSI|nr:hypothetical protein HHK36_030481 [Tetracentron sinense]